MNTYTFNVSFLGSMKIDVIAQSREEARKILNDTIDNLTIKDIKSNEITTKENVTLKSNDFNVKISSEQNKDLER